MFNSRIGAQHFGPAYQFTDEHWLLEGAKELLRLGSDVLKILLQGKDSGEVLEVMNQPYYKETLELGFNTYMFWIHPEYSEFMIMDGVEIDRNVYDTTVAAANLLCDRFEQTEKTFLFGNWEGDWLYIGLGNVGSKAPDPENARKLIAGFRARQKAVETVRNSRLTGKPMKLGAYVEVNLPIMPKDLGVPRLENEVLPHITVDLVSISSYEALWPPRLTEALDYVEEMACFTDYFDDVYQKKVFIGEYCDMYDDGYGLDFAERKKNLDICFASVLAWGAPFLLYWELYNNERGNHFYLVDPHGRETYAYEAHKQVLIKINLANMLWHKLFGEQLPQPVLSRLGGFITEGDTVHFVRHFFELPMIEALSPKSAVEKLGLEFAGGDSLYKAVCEALDKQFPDAMVFSKCLGFKNRFMRLPMIEDSSAKLWEFYLSDALFEENVLSNRDKPTEVCLFGNDKN